MFFTSVCMYCMCKHCLIAAQHCAMAITFHNVLSYYNLINFEILESKKCNYTYNTEWCGYFSIGIGTLQYGHG